MEMNQKRHRSAHCRHHQLDCDDQIQQKSIVHSWKGSVKSLIDLYNNDIQFTGKTPDVITQSDMLKGRQYSSQQSLPLSSHLQERNTTVSINKQRADQQSNSTSSDRSDFNGSIPFKWKINSPLGFSENLACSTGTLKNTNNTRSQQNNHHHQLSPCKRRQLFKQNRNLTSPPLISKSVDNSIVNNSMHLNDLQKGSHFSKSFSNLYDHKQNMQPPHGSQIDTMHCLPNTVQKLRALFNGDRHLSRQCTINEPQKPLKSSKLSVQIGNNSSSYSNSSKEYSRPLANNTFRSCLYLDNTTSRNFNFSTSNSNNDINDKEQIQSNSKSNVYPKRQILHNNVLKPLSSLEIKSYDQNTQTQSHQLQNYNLHGPTYRPLMSNVSRSHSTDWHRNKEKNQNVTFYFDSTSTSSSSDDNDSCIGNSICSESFRPTLQTLNYESDDSVCGIPKPISFLYKSNESINHDMDRSDYFLRGGSKLNNERNTGRGQPKFRHQLSNPFPEKCSIKYLKRSRSFRDDDIYPATLVENKRF